MARTMEKQPYEEIDLRPGGFIRSALTPTELDDIRKNFLVGSYDPAAKLTPEPKKTTKLREQANRVAMEFDEGIL